MGILTPPLTAPGPVTWMALALQARLQAVFPPAFFDFHWMPAKLTRDWFKAYAKRLPAIGVGFNGLTGERDDGAVWMGRAHFTVVTMVKNESGVAQRYFGDALKPGLFAMERVARVALHGFECDPDGTPWSANGPFIVSQSGNLYDAEWGEENLAFAGLDVSILFEECLPPGLELAPSTAALVDNITWNFGEQAPLLTDTIDTGST